MTINHVLLCNNNGNRNHYYHFFYGIYLPLCEYLASVTNDESSKVVTASCNEMNRHLFDHPMVPPDCSLEVIPLIAMPPDSICIRGLDDFSERMESFFLRTKESVREVLLQRFGVHDFVGRKTLVVQRINPTDGQYTNESTGAKRRYIVNHSRIVARLRESGHDVEEVTLEQMTMAQQACRFWSASTIVAQHGAGLSNIYFCRPGCKVIELGANGRRHFSRLAESLGLQYRHIETKPRGEGPCFANPMDVVSAADDDATPKNCL